MTSEKSKASKKEIVELLDMLFESDDDSFNLLDWMQDYKIHVTNDNVNFELDYIVDLLDVIHQYLLEIVATGGINRSNGKAIAKMGHLIEFVESNKEFMDTIFYSKKFGELPELASKVIEMKSNEKKRASK